MSKTHTITVTADTLSAALGAVLADLGLPTTAKSRALNTLARKIACDGKTNWGGLKAKGHFVEAGLSLDTVRDAGAKAGEPIFHVEDFMTEAGLVRVTCSDNDIPSLLQFHMPDGETYEADPFTFLRSKVDNPTSSRTLANFITATGASEETCTQIIADARAWLREWRHSSRVFARFENNLVGHLRTFQRILFQQTGLTFDTFRDTQPAFDLLLERVILKRDLLKDEANIPHTGLDWIWDALERDPEFLFYGVSLLSEFLNARKEGRPHALRLPVWDDRAPMPLLGWQVEHEETSLHWNDRPSYDVICNLDVAHAELRAAQAADVRYRMIPIYFGAVGEPMLSWQ